MTGGSAERVALICGGSGGIGAAIARRLSRDGFTVLVAGRNLQIAREVARSIADRGGTAVPLRCDVTNRDDVEGAVDLAVTDHGGLHVVINSAGNTRDNLIHKMTDEEWNSVITTHLTGAFLLARAAQRPMVRQRFGKIVFLGSTASAGNRGQVNYSAAKAGLQGMTRTLAIELGPFGITVNLLSPGHIDSPMTRALAARLDVDYDQIRQNRIAENAIKRVGTPDDIANVAGFLISEECSYLTGQTITVSGRPATS